MRPFECTRATSDQDEAAFIIDRIKKLVLEEGYSRSDIAILYRSNAQSRVVEQALFNAGMPYRVYGGLRFFERAEIKHALAYLRLMDNADDRQFLLTRGQLSGTRHWCAQRRAAARHFHCAGQPRFIVPFTAWKAGQQGRFEKIC